ncbi:MAG TPA: tyrosine-type recombinase/integrase [Acidimicrobiia bacterium]
MSAQPAEKFETVTAAGRGWERINRIAPTMAATMGRYLEQVATFLAPRSVEVADISLRQFAGWLLESTEARNVAAISRADLEDYKRWLAAQPGTTGKPLAANTRRQRLHTLRMFFDRLIEWDWTDAPARNPVIGGDIPASPDPLPKFLDDTAAAKFMATAREVDDPRDRVVCELLARTGLRASELCDLAADAVVLIGENHWLRVPLGKLRNDRYVPLHPDLTSALARWTADNIDRIRRHRRLIADHRGPLDRHAVGRIVARVGRRAGIDVHPHQLRHTLATQAINRGMRLEAIAALLGHRSMHMTLTYARIADRVVADQYAAISSRIDALYNQPPELPADYETTGMARLRRDAHARMLGNGLCTRPAQLDCRMETICETCSYFQTTIEFRPTLIRQRDHAREHGQTDRAALYDKLVTRVDKDAS